MKKTEQGFSLVEVLLVLLLVSFVSFAGWFVYNKQSDKKEETPVSKTEDVNKTTDTTTVSDGYLKVPEFGVKVKLTADVSDLEYAIKTNDKGEKYGVFSTKSLTKLEPECAASGKSSAGVEGFGLIVSFKDPSAQGNYEGSTLADEYPDNIKVGDTYYDVSPDVQAVCYDEAKHPYGTSDVSKKVSAGIKFLKEAKLEKL